MEVFKKSLRLQDTDPEVTHWINSYEGPLCVACSGGPDSMALVAWVRHYFPHRPCIVLHYNHKVRAVSDKEEMLLKTWAHDQHLTLEVGHRSKNIGITESELRHARYQFFEKMLCFHKSTLLLLGHHQDDQVETVMMRLMRGVSLDGLIAPRAVHRMKRYVKLRPLLNFPKQTLIDLCKHLNIPYFTDVTNMQACCVRNRVRQNILNGLDMTFEGVNWRKGFKRTCRILAEQRDFLEQYLQQKFANFSFLQPQICWETLESLSIYEQRYCLQKWLQIQGIRNFGFETLDRIFFKIASGENTTLALDSTKTLSICLPYLYLNNLNKQSAPFELNMVGQHSCVCFPDGHQLKIQYVPCTHDLYADVVSGEYAYDTYAILDVNVFPKKVIVRNWRPGDYYRPIHQSVVKNVSHLFNARKISIESRCTRPVICDGVGKILWVPGLPPSEDFKLQKNSKMCVFLIYKKT